MKKKKKMKKEMTKKKKTIKRRKMKKRMMEELVMERTNKHPITKTRKPHKHMLLTTKPWSVSQSLSIDTQPVSFYSHIPHTLFLHTLFPIPHSFILYLIPHTSFLHSFIPCLCFSSNGQPSIISITRSHHHQWW